MPRKWPIRWPEGDPPLKLLVQDNANVAGDRNTFRLMVRQDTIRDLYEMYPDRTPKSRGWWATRFGVSEETIRKDLAALGVPRVRAPKGCKEEYDG